MHKRLRIALFLLLFVQVIGVGQNVAGSQRDICPMMVGSTLPPKVELIDSSEKKISSSDLLRGKATVLVFYRGGWCPYGQSQLKEIEEHSSEIASLGYQIVAVSPDNAYFTKETAKKLSITYRLLSDCKNGLANEMGLVFKVSSEYKNLLLKNSDGLNKGFLPANAIYILNKNMEVIFSYVPQNYKIRPKISTLLALLESNK